MALDLRINLTQFGYTNLIDHATPDRGSSTMSTITLTDIAEILANVSRHEYISDFLKHEVSKLHSRETCWPQSGVAGLLYALRANLSETQSWNNSIIEQGPYYFNSTGNVYLVDFATNEFTVNGVDKDTFITLSYVHCKFDLQCLRYV